MTKQNLTVLTLRVESRIFVIRGRKVILDTDLAEIHGVAVKRLNEQVKRNAERFPFDFVFRLDSEALRSQFATSNTRKEGTGRGGRRYRPFVFTEHGAIMAATVLNSKKAVEMSIFIVRAFVRMREGLATNHKMIVKLRELERRVGSHDSDIEEIVAALREMMRPPASPGRKIGFETPRANV
jgi:phage regulator Rha-like protein